MKQNVKTWRRTGLNPRLFYTIHHRNLPSVAVGCLPLCSVRFRSTVPLVLTVMVFSWFVLCRKMTHALTSSSLLNVATTRQKLELAACRCIQRVQVNWSSCTFDYVVCFMNVAQERKTASPGNHFTEGHFPNDMGWRWNDESWNDMILLAELGASRQKTGSLCSAAVSVLPEPWNNDPSLFISVYSVNHNTSEMSLAFRRRTIDLVCALPHQRAVTGLHPNWGN